MDQAKRLEIIGSDVCQLQKYPHACDESFRELQEVCAFLIIIATLRDVLHYLRFVVQYLFHQLPWVVPSFHQINRR